MPQPTRPNRQHADATAGALLLLVAAAVAATLAVNHWSRSTNTSLQQHVLTIASQLRAPGDHNSMTVATSSLTTAQHMRYQIQQDLLAGMSNHQILETMEQVYGSRVLAAPAFGGIGRLFWVLPWLVLAMLGVAGGLLLHRGMQTQPVLEQPDANAEPTKVDRDAVDTRLQDYL